jgi:hypothetical protein
MKIISPFLGRFVCAALVCPCSFVSLFGFRVGGGAVALCLLRAIVDHLLVAKE